MEEGGALETRLETALQALKSVGRIQKRVIKSVLHVRLPPPNPRPVQQAAYGPRGSTAPEVRTHALGLHDPEEIPQDV